MHRIIVSLLSFYLFFIFLAVPVKTQSPLEDDVRAMKAQFEIMQTRLKELEAKVATQETEIHNQRAAKEAYAQRIKELEDQVGEQSVPAQRKWMPDIEVVADVVYTQNSAKEDEEGADRVSVRELELVLGSDVDPYSRLDAAIAFSDTEDPSLEEAYLTHSGLPLDTIARFGKFKPNVGKAIPLHRHRLDTVEEPLVIQRYFGVEGFNKSGVDLTKMLEFPWPVTHQLSFGVLEGGNGEEGAAFGDTRRIPTIYSHLKNYFDLNETTGFELGFTHLSGSRDEDSGFEVQVVGADATLTKQFNANQRLKIQGEVYNLNRKDSFIETEEDDGLGGTRLVWHRLDGNLWGTYGLLDFRLHPRWSTGFRYDYVEPVPEDSPLDVDQEAEKAYTGYFTFYQSEFARWRMQFTHTDLPFAKDDNAVYIQGTFAIGVRGSHDHDHDDRH